MKRPIVVSVVNHKGGVLKTTVSVNLAAALVKKGKKVLVIDLDAQQNLTASFLGLLEAKEGERTLLNALLEEETLDELIRPTHIKGLDIIPVTEEFAAAELSLVNVVARESILRGCFSKSRRLENYDFIFLDNPPSLSLVVMNSLVASDHFLVPCSAEFLPTVGLSLLSESINQILRVNPTLGGIGVVLTMYSRNEKASRNTEAALREDLGDFLWKAKVRVNTKAKSAPMSRKTIFEYERSERGRGTEDFNALADEFLARVDAIWNPKQLRRVANG